MKNILTMLEINHAWPQAAMKAENNKFDLSDVPSNLKLLAPYAAVWGIADDWRRQDALKVTPPVLLDSLKVVVSENEDALDDWLAGPEAASSKPSDAYVAYSAMRLAADFI